MGASFFLFSQIKRGCEKPIKLTIGLFSTIGALPPIQFEYLERVRAYSILNRISDISIRLLSLSLIICDHSFNNLNSSPATLASIEAILLPLNTIDSGSKYMVFPDAEES